MDAERAATISITNEAPRLPAGEAHSVNMRTSYADHDILLHAPAGILKGQEKDRTDRKGKQGARNTALHLAPKTKFHSNTYPNQDSSMCPAKDPLPRYNFNCSPEQRQFF